MSSFRRLFVSRAATRLPAWAPLRSGFRWNSTTTPTATGSQGLPVVPRLDAENFALYKERVDDVILRTPTVEEEGTLEKLCKEVSANYQVFIDKVAKTKSETLLYCWRGSVRDSSDLEEALIDFFSYINLKVNTHLSGEALEDPSLHQWGCAFVGTRFMPRPLLPSTLPNGTDIGCPFFCLGDPQQLDSIITYVEGASNNVLSVVYDDTLERTTIRNLLFLGGDSGSGKTHAALFLAAYLHRRGVDFGGQRPVVVYAVARDIFDCNLCKEVEAHDSVAQDDVTDAGKRRAARTQREKHTVDLLESAIRTSIGDHIEDWHQYYSPDKLPSCFLVLDELMGAPALMHALTSVELENAAGTLVVLGLKECLKDLFRNVQVVGASTASSASVEINCSLASEVHAYQLLPSSVLFEKQMTELKPLYKCLSTNVPYMYVMHNYRCATEALKILQEEEKNFYKVLSDALGALQPWRALYKTLRKWCNMGSTSPNPTQIFSARTKLAALCDNLEAVMKHVEDKETENVNNDVEKEESPDRANPQDTLEKLKSLPSVLRTGLLLLESSGTSAGNNNKTSNKSKKSTNRTTNSCKQPTTTTTNTTTSGNKQIKSIVADSNKSRGDKKWNTNRTTTNNNCFDAKELKAWLDGKPTPSFAVDQVKEAVFSHAAAIVSAVVEKYKKTNALSTRSDNDIYGVAQQGAVLCLTGKHKWDNSNNDNHNANDNNNHTTCDDDSAGLRSTGSNKKSFSEPVTTGMVSVDSRRIVNYNTKELVDDAVYRMGMYQLILGMTAAPGSNAASEGNRIATPPTIRELCSFHPRGLVKFWLHLFAFLSEALRRHAAGGDAARVFTTVVEQFRYSKTTLPLTEVQKEVLALMDAGITDATTLLKAPVAFPGSWRTLQHVDDWAKEDHRSQITESFCHGVDRDPAKRKGLSLILNSESATYADTAVIGRGAFALVSVKRRVDYGRNRKELLRDVATLGFRVPELEEEHQKGAYELQIAATAQLKAHLQCPVTVPVFVLFHKPHYNILRNMPEVEVRAAKEGGTPALKMKPIVLHIRPYLEYSDPTKVDSFPKASISPPDGSSDSQ